MRTEETTVEAMTREMATIRVNRLESKPGDWVKSKRIIISREFWVDSGIALPEGFKDDDQMAVDILFHNDNGELVEVEHAFLLASCVR